MSSSDAAPTGGVTTATTADTRRGAPTSDPPPARPLSEAIRALRDGVDALLVGQEEAKLGVLLGLVAREHVFLEGPPGCGKSVLAEGAARVLGARSHLVAFHRDTRESDLLGDSVLQRSKRRGDEPDRGRRGGALERIRVALAPGPMLRAEVVVLEEISRAPGEALAPLLRILGARRALGESLPLESTIATAPLDGPGTPVDPLEPGQLDRFAIQVRLRGLAESRRWWAVQRLLERSCDSARTDCEALPVLRPGERQAIQDRVDAMPLGEELMARYHEWVRRVRALAAAADGEALISDRAFGRLALRILRAHAVLRSAAVAEPADLRALRLMMGRRLPPEILELLDDVTEDLVRPREQAQADGHESSRGASSSLGDEGLEADGDGGDHLSLDGSEVASPPVGEDEEEREVGLVERPAPPADVAELLRAFEGRIDRGRSDPGDDPGGQPRSYRPLRRLDELLDGDLVEAILFAEGSLPGSPRTYRRTRRNAGGAVVILRDVSSSMAGQRNTWAGQVVRALVEVAARRRMRVGYVEFHHRALPREVAGRLLHRSYPRLFQLAANAHPLGQTNYEEPLSLALESLRGGRGRNRHVVMLTDGLPITGDTRVRGERLLAQRLGVCLHTVFIGEGACPAVLDEISQETGGLRYQARPEDGGLRVAARGGDATASGSLVRRAS